MTEGGSDNEIQNRRVKAIGCFAQPVIGGALARSVGSQ
jgi:hypothetical protein